MGILMNSCIFAVIPDTFQIFQYLVQWLSFSIPIYTYVYGNIFHDVNKNLSGVFYNNYTTVDLQWLEPISGSNTDGSFTTPVSNSFLNILEKIP